MSVSVVIGYFQDFPILLFDKSHRGWVWKFWLWTVGGTFMITWSSVRGISQIQLASFERCCAVGNRLKKVILWIQTWHIAFVQLFALERLHSSRSWIGLLAFGSRVKLLSKWSIILRAIFQKIEKICKYASLKAKLRGKQAWCDAWDEANSSKGTYLCLLIALIHQAIVPKTNNGVNQSPTYV